MSAEVPLDYTGGIQTPVGYLLYFPSSIMPAKIWHNHSRIVYMPDLCILAGLDVQSVSYETIMLRAA